jgi:hypothetical protein
MQKEVVSGTRGTKTMTLESGMQVEVNIKLPCNYSQNPLQFFNDLDRLKMDGLITDSEYGQLQSIKSDLTAKQTEYTNALTNAKALETAKQELKTASEKTYLPTGSSAFDAISSILSQRSQLPAELQPYWNEFSYESMDASLKRAQDLHQQKLDQKVDQLEQKKIDATTAEARYTPMKAEFLSQLESSSMPEDQKVGIRNCIDLDFVEINGNKVTLLGDSNILLIPLQKYAPALQKMFAQLKNLSPKFSKEQIKVLDKEVKTLQENGSSAGLQAAIVSKQVQISLEPNLFKVAQQIRGGAQFDLGSLSRAVVHIKSDVTGGTSGVVHNALKQFQEFSSALGYPTQNIDEIKGLMNLVTHLQAHNSLEDIHALAENIAQSKTFANMPGAEGLRNTFFAYLQKMT